MTVETKFNCEKYDNHLYQTMVTINSSFTIANVKIKYEETKTIDNHFFYYIINLNNKLEGYVGRDINTSKIVYIIKDRGLINWAKKEGFYDSKDNEQLLINGNIDIMRRLSSIVSFINFMSGEHNYSFDKSLNNTKKTIKKSQKI